MNAPAAAKRPRASARRIDAVYWMRLLEVMRTGCSAKEAAEKLKIDRKTIRRLMEHGVPGTPWGERSMSTVLAEERRAAVAVSVAKENATEGATAIASVPAASAEEALAARRAEIATRAEELKLVRYTRANVQAMLAVTTHVTKGALAVAKRLSAALEKPSTMSAGQALLLLTRAGSIVQKAVYAAETIVQLQRAVGGDDKDPSAIEGALDADDMSDDEALTELRHAHDVYLRAQRAGLVVHDGGLSGSPAAAVNAQDPIDPPPAVNTEAPSTSPKE